MKDNRNDASEESDGSLELTMDMRKIIPKANQALEEIIDNPKVSASARVKAIEVVYDRAYGRPKSKIEFVASMSTETLTIMGEAILRTRQLMSSSKVIEASIDSDDNDS